MSRDSFWEDDAVDVDAQPAAGDDFWEADALDDAPLPRPKMSEVESAARGAAQGVAFDFVDEISGALGAGGDVLFGDTALGDIDDAYVKNRDESRENFRRAQEDNPGLYTAGQVGGGLATAFVPGLGWANAAKGAPLAARLGTAALAGGLTGAGGSESSPTDIAEFGKDVAVGAGAGVLTQGLFDAAGPAIAAGARRVAKPIGNAVRGTAKWLKGSGEELAFKAAAGNQAKVWDEAVRQGRVNEIGRDLLDDGVVTAGSTARDISERAGEKVDEAWEGMKELFDQVDQAAPQGVVSGKSIADKLRAYAKEIGGTGNKALVGRLAEAADELEQLGTMTLAAAQREKNSWHFTPGDPSSVPKQVSNKVKSIIGGGMEEGVDSYGKSAASVAEEVVSPPSQFAEVLQTGNGTSVPQQGGAVFREAEEVASQGIAPEKSLELYKALKSKYGNMATADDAAEITANRIAKNQKISLGDKMAAAAGAAAGGWKGMALGVANKVARERGASTGAVALDKIGDLLAKTPEAFGRWAPQLRDAAGRGNHALAVTHFLLLQQDPEYRKQVGGD